MTAYTLQKFSQCIPLEYYIISLFVFHEVLKIDSTIWSYKYHSELNAQLFLKIIS